MKNPNREIQNRAVAQPLVVGRMTAMLSGIAETLWVGNPLRQWRHVLADTGEVCDFDKARVKFGESCHNVSHFKGNNL